MPSGKKLEKILWSIAIPGFGQLLNGKPLKGILFIALEFWINTNARLNEMIALSFQGKIPEAIHATNVQWLMFYPCVYMFATWDAYRDSGGGEPPFAYLPFVLSAFWGTIGIMYSSQLTIMGHLLGPVWLPMILAFIGVFVGYLLQTFLRSLVKGE